MLIAILTGAAGATLGGSGWQVLGGCAYIVIAAAALFSPAAIILQVIAGQLLVGSVLPARDGAALAVLLPLVAGVVATAELSAIVGRLDSAIERDRRQDLRRAGLATLIAGGVSGAVILAGALPGPPGLPATLLASAACVALAILLAGGNR